MRVPEWMRSVELWQVGVAVRRDWPDGSHDLFGWQARGADLRPLVHTDRARWRRGPLRPMAYRVVAVSARDFLLHGRRDGCRAPDCPTQEDPGVLVSDQRAFFG